MVCYSRSSSGKCSRRKWGSRAFREGVWNWLRNPLLPVNTIHNPLKIPGARPSAQRLKKIKIALRDWNFQARLKRMTFSSEIEHFKRATHQNPIFVGNSQGQDWKFQAKTWSFQARLKISNENLKFSSVQARLVFFKIRALWDWVPELILDSFPESYRTSLSSAWFSGTFQGVALSRGRSRNCLRARMRGRRRGHVGVWRGILLFSLTVWAGSGIEWRDTQRNTHRNVHANVAATL